jgi:hypothetical protein
MKKNSILLLLTFFSLAFGQSQNFSAVDKRLQWQKIYNTTLKLDEILSKINNGGKFINIKNSNNVIDADFKDFSIDYLGAGNHFISVTEYIESSIFSGHAKIEYKEGKYRVIINDITYQYRKSKLIQRSPNQINNPIENKAIDKKTGNLNARFRKDAFMFDYSFNALFDFDNSVKTDEW